VSVGMLRRSGGRHDATCTSADMAHLTLVHGIGTGRSGMCCSTVAGCAAGRRRGPQRHGRDVLDGVLGGLPLLQAGVSRGRA
jgi:hypothetical protein